MKSALLSQRFHSFTAASVMVAVAALYLAVTGGIDTAIPPQTETGVALPSPSSWPLPAWAGTGINIGLNLLIMLMMYNVNKAYNVLRAVTKLHIGLFAVMQAAIPASVLTLNSGTLLALSVICGIYLMFSCYDNPWRTRRVFLTFLLLSLGAAVQYCFVVFIPVFWLMCAQMRIPAPRTYIASVLGLLTVWILLPGFGVVTAADFRLPSPAAIFSAMNPGSAVYLLIVAGYTAFLLVTSTALNVMKTIAYNARARAYNGALTVVAVTTVAAMILNYNNIMAYLPLLNMCAAYQLTHYFVNHRFDRQYAAVLSVATVYIILYLWRIAI